MVNQHIINRCRRHNHYLPWHCGDLRHDYEVCLFQQLEKRKEIKKEMKKG